MVSIQFVYLIHFYHAFFDFIGVEDLQWADAFTINIIGDYINQGAGSYNNSAFSNENIVPGNMMLLGSFRDDEV